MINQKRKQKLLLPGFPGMNYKKNPRFCDTFFMRKNDIDIHQTSAKICCVSIEHRINRCHAANWIESLASGSMAQLS